MKTLVIHPQDPSTDFLKAVYNRDEVTLVTGGDDRDTLSSMIDEHDHIMMMGHGSPAGLLSVGQFPGAYVINDAHAKQLRGKGGSVFIWCDADRFVELNELAGFYTGMFVSDLSEAVAMGITNATQPDVDESNRVFAFGAGQERTPHNMWARALQQYSLIVDRNPVAKYNYLRLRFNGR